jgi:hypothetical protein
MRRQLVGPACQDCTKMQQRSNDDMHDVSATPRTACGLWQLGTCRRMRHQSSLIAVLWFGANVLPRQPSVGHRVGGLQSITHVTLKL